MSDTDSNNEEIEELLNSIGQGDASAMSDLVELIYPQLKRLAHLQLAGERAGHTLSTTAIVHEAYLRMVPGDEGWTDRRHFLRAAATVMRHLLVDHARKRNASKRGDGIVPLPLDEVRVGAEDDTVAVLALDNAIKELAEINPRFEQIIECRYFAGLSVKDTAEALGLSVRTVQRDALRAQVYLSRTKEPDRI